MGRKTGIALRAVAIMLASIVPFAATAGGLEPDRSPVEPPPGAEIRYITPDGGSSPCFGDLTKPLCAIETAIGCTHYVWNPACPLVTRWKGNDPENLRVEYIVLRAGSVNRERVKKLKEGDNSDPPEYGWVRPNSVQAHFLGRTCPAREHTCDGVSWMASLINVNFSPVEDSWFVTLSGLWDGRDWFVD